MNIRWPWQARVSEQYISAVSCDFTISSMFWERWFSMVVVARVNIAYQCLWAQVVIFARVISYEVCREIIVGKVHRTQWESVIKRLSQRVSRLAIPLSPVKSSRSILEFSTDFHCKCVLCRIFMQVCFLITGGYIKYFCIVLVLSFQHQSQTTAANVSSHIDERYWLRRRNQTDFHKCIATSPCSPHSTSVCSCSGSNCVENNMWIVPREWPDQPIKAVCE